MYPIHPLTVHVPIGLLVGNAILTLLYLRRGDQGLEVGAYHCLWLGWVATLPAVATGTLTAAQQWLRPESDATVLAWINAHALCGIAVMVVYWQAWQARRRDPAILANQQRRRGYLVRLGFGLVLLAASGWLGGHLVYYLRVGVN